MSKSNLGYDFRSFESKNRIATSCRGFNLITIVEGKVLMLVELDVDGTKARWLEVPCVVKEMRERTRSRLAAESLVSST
jgi:hypothetical protein